MQRVLESPPEAPSESRPVPKLSPRLRALIDADARASGPADRDALQAFFKRCDNECASDSLRRASWALSMVRGAIVDSHR